MGTVRSTDRDSQRVATCTGSEVDNLLRLGVVRLSSADLILNTSKHTELSLNGYVELMSWVYSQVLRMRLLLLRATTPSLRRLSTSLPVLVATLWLSLSVLLMVPTSSLQSSAHL